MELKEGTYIRTKDGIIDKVIIDYKGHCNNPNCNYKHISCKYNYYDESKVIKTSNNIIDLIEDGDYVNGMEVMDADWFNEEGNYEEGLAFPMYASDDLDIIENWQPLKYVKIKSIVTKEQFESMEYKL